MNVDAFVEEIFRVLRPNGYAVISTENLASWHNVFALLLGQQAFSQSISRKLHIGCHLSHHYKEETGSWAKDSGPPHNKVLAYYGLKEITELYGFQIEKILGAGYYPFPKALSRFFSRLDPIHTHFITIKVRK